MKYVERTHHRAAIDGWSLYFYKDKDFIWEREFRVVTFATLEEHACFDEDKNKGRYMNVRLPEFVLEVALHPYAPPSMHEHVKILAQRYCGGCTVRQSNLQSAMQRYEEKHGHLPVA